MVKVNKKLTIKIQNAEGRDETMSRLKENYMVEKMTGEGLKGITGIRKARNLPVVSYDGTNAGVLFKAYFNNKMAVILLLLYKRRLDAGSAAAQTAAVFFDDLYRHMLPVEFQPGYHRVFQWLKLFFQRFPYVKLVQRLKAAEYIRIVYRLFGFDLSWTF